MTCKEWRKRNLYHLMFIKQSIRDESWSGALYAKLRSVEHVLKLMGAMEGLGAGTRHGQMHMRPLISGTVRVEQKGKEVG